MNKAIDPIIASIMFLCCVYSCYRFSDEIQWWCCWCLEKTRCFYSQQSESINVHSICKNLATQSKILLEFSYIVVIVGNSKGMPLVCDCRWGGESHSKLSLLTSITLCYCLLCIFLSLLSMERPTVQLLSFIQRLRELISIRQSEYKEFHTLILPCSVLDKAEL